MNSTSFWLHLSLLWIACSFTGILAPISQLHSVTVCAAFGPPPMTDTSSQTPGTLCTFCTEHSSHRCLKTVDLITLYFRLPSRLGIQQVLHKYHTDLVSSHCTHALPLPSLRWLRDLLTLPPSSPQLCLSAVKLQDGGSLRPWAPEAPPILLCLTCHVPPVGNDIYSARFRISC